MFGAFHKKGSVPRLHKKRKDGGRELINVYDCVKQEELALSEYVKETEEWMLKVAGETVHAEETKNEYKKRVEKTRMECFLGKRLHGKFMRDVFKVADGRSWQWLRAGYLGKGIQKGMFLLLTNRHCGQGSFVQQLSGGMLIRSEEFVVKKWRMSEVRVSEDGEVEIRWDRRVETTLPRNVEFSFIVSGTKRTYTFHTPNALPVLADIFTSYNDLFPVTDCLLA